MMKKVSLKYLLEKHTDDRDLNREADRKRICEVSKGNLFYSKKS